MSAAAEPTVVAPPRAASSTLLCWGPVALYNRGVQAYRAAIPCVARMWTPPSAFDGIESAPFVFFFSATLFVMEGFHASRYALRQLRRFKAQTTRRHVSVSGDGVHTAPPIDHDARKGEAKEIVGASRETLEADADEDAQRGQDGEEDTLSALANPLTWYQRVLQRISVVPPTGAGKASAALSDGRHPEEVVIRESRLQQAESAGSVSDFMRRHMKSPFETPDFPVQREESQFANAAADGAPNTTVPDDVEVDDDEEQTWEASPEMLMHYWRQLQRTILTAPRRNAEAFFRNLPDEMTAYQPDTPALDAWFDEITRHLHGGPSLWAWFSAAAAPEARSTEEDRGTSLKAMMRAREWQQRLVFSVPPNGCFAYNTKPTLDEFYPETEEDSDEDEEPYEEPLLHQGADAGRGGQTNRRDLSAEWAREGGAGVADTAGHAQDANELHQRVHTLHWEALMLVWCNVVEVPMSSREIRALLLKASPPAFMDPAMVRNDGPTAFDLASANLSLLWFWSTLQRVFETLVVNEDVEKCETHIEELQSYAMPLFIKCIARWPVPSQMEVALSHGLICFACVVQSAWMTLTAVMQKLLSLRRRLYCRNTWSLLRYMYASSKAKLMSAALITVMMTLSSRVSAAGRVVRERIASYVENGAEVGGAAVGGGSGPKMSLRLMLGLCAFELTRMAAQYVIVNTTSEFIVLTASQRREVVKMQLYEALSHTQLTFYEQHTYEEVEEIIYYVSDMEGVDVQLHQYLFNAINVFIELRDALQTFTYRSIIVATGVAVGPYALRRIASVVEQRYLRAQREGYLPSGAYVAEETYRDADDDADVLREGAMLRGDEIIAAIPQLRPYGADVRLVRWWNRHRQRLQHIQLGVHQQRSGAVSRRKWRAGGGDVDSPRSGARGPASGGHCCTASINRDGGAAVPTPRFSWGRCLQSFVRAWVTNEDIGLMCSALTAVVRLPHGKLLPGFGKALLDLSEWLLPMAASAYGIAWCDQPNLDSFQLVQGVQAIEAAVDSLNEAVDTVEMVGYNAYKASMLERLLQPTQWEVISREEEPYMANFTISAAGVGRANDARLCCLEKASPLAKPVPTRPLTTVLHATTARAAGFYRRHVLRHIEIDNIRLRCVLNGLTEPRKRRSGPASASVARQGTPDSASLQSEDDRDSSRIEGAAAPRADSIDRKAEDDEEGDEMRSSLNDGAPRFSADIVLWSPPQQRGRFVCITGPNGGGKTALVNLLLALYVNASGFTASSVASSPHAGRLGSGSVTFCFAGRTHARRHRRGGLTSRTADSSQVNVTRASHGVYDPLRLHSGATSPAPDGGHRWHAPGSPALSAAQTGRSTPPYSGGSNSAAAGSGGELRVDIRSIPVDVLRRHIFSYVPEMPTIFTGATVAQNISLAGYVSVATDSLMRRVSQCAELAHCDFVQRLPLGMLTRVSDTTANSWCTAGQYSNGVGNTSVTRLSADQAKRLMLARAYFHGGEVLLMDEPTKEIEDPATSQGMCDGWCRLLERGYCSGVICMTMDATLLNRADEVITLP
ncbi:hypothetical protein ABL78_3363 [Leptomonas seymouri]|uniref:Uncharacterized protein n=1 Tax=Leptomonas seymouri TaxID=5684 RepID=A0A0N0P6F1_LEPSE|nr:hypothetical protein ABL78_3363 [Leptomonas seymouri]|eukprot:KPI87566.1 hypothetical protein ABL78_3363 [Leptomonas seymouri]